MPGLCHRSGGVSTVHCCFNSCSSASSSSASSCNGNGSSACNASNGIWSRSRDDITYAQLAKFWSDLPCAARQELLRIDKQSLFEQVRKNLYCSRCNGLLLEVYSQVVHYGRNLHHEVPCPTTGAAAGHGRYQNGNTSKFMVSSTHEDTGDPSVHPWGGLTATRDGILTLLDCFLVGTSLEALQNVFDSARARERERELLYPDACGGGGRGWISQGTSISGRGHGLKETCALHTARLSCDALVDFWSALGEETRLSLLRMKEEDFIERLMFRFDSKRFCRDCRRNVLREFKELKELKRTRREPRCNMWFCVADTAFQYEVSESSVQADWHEWFAEAGGIYARFEWALGTGEGKSDILGFEDVGLSESVQACGLALDNITACYITLRAWKHDGRCTEVSVKAHALEGRLCVHRRLIVGDGYVTITKGESIKKFFEHAEETEEEEDEESADRDGNDMDNEGSRFQKHAKSPELARDFLLDAATVIFKEQVEKAFREGTARQNAHNIFVCLALGLLEDRVHIACKEIITLEKQNKLLEEEAAEKREEEERKERRRQKEREKKLKKREKLKGKDKDRENNIYEAKASASSVDSINGEVLREEQDISVANGIETSTEAAADVFVPFSPMLADEAVDGCLVEDEKGNGENMSNLHADVHGEINSKDVSGGAFIFGPSKSSRRKSKIGKGNISEMSTIRLYRKSYPSMEINGHVRGSERFQSYPSMEVNGHVRGFERFQPASYSDVASRSIHGVARQSKSLKSEHFGKADTKSNLLKGYEKLNVPNGRGHYRYDYSFCGCNSQSSSKFTRDSRPDRVDSSLDLSRHFYRISNHPSGSVSDHCGVVKGKLKQGTGSGMRGEFVQKKVWEPLDLRQQVNKAASQPSNVLSSMSQNINAQTKADSSSVNSLPPVSDQSPSQCSKLNELPNNETGCISSNQLSTGSFETCVITSNSSQSDTRKHDDDTIQHPVSSSMPGSLVLDQLESDAAGDATAEKHVCSVESSTSEPLAVNNDLSTSTVDVSPAEMKMTDDSLLATHLNEPCNEKPNDSPARKDNVCVESGSNHGFQDISKNIPASNTFSKTEDVQLHVTEGRSQFESSSSHFINDYESNVLTRPISANHILNTPEITSTPQVLPMCLPSIAPPIIPLHPQHHQGYYQCSAAWHPISSNGLLPFPQHNGFMYPGQSPYGLSSTRLSPFSIPYSSIQPFPPVLASSQITSFPHQATTSNYNDLSNSLRSGESDTEAIKHGPGINLQLEKNSTLKEVSNGHPSAEVRSTQQDVTSSSSPENDSTNFSLFHFGGLDAVITGGSEGNSYSGGETVKQLISSNDTSVALLSNDFPSQQEQVPVEEYSLFAASRGSRLPFFNQVHNQVH